VGWADGRGCGRGGEGVYRGEDRGGVMTKPILPRTRIYDYERMCSQRASSLSVLWWSIVAAGVIAVLTVVVGVVAWRLM